MFAVYFYCLCSLAEHASCNRYPFCQRTPIVPHTETGAPCRSPKSPAKNVSTRFFTFLQWRRRDLAGGTTIGPVCLFRWRIQGVEKRLGGPPEMHTSHYSPHYCISAAAKLRWRPENETRDMRSHRRTMRRRGYAVCLNERLRDVEGSLLHCRCPGPARNDPVGTRRALALAPIGLQGGCESGQSAHSSVGTRERLPLGCLCLR